MAVFGQVSRIRHLRAGRIWAMAAVSLGVEFGLGNLMMGKMYPKE
jgi:hypothetical protein